MKHNTELKNIESRFRRTLFKTSLVQHGRAVYWMEQRRGIHQLMVLSQPRGAARLFDGVAENYDDARILKRCALNHANARALRKSLPWLAPRPLGIQTSFGFGDRLGLATPGHVRAMNELIARQSPLAYKVAPIFAQQSIREMARAHRTPDDVMTDATFGAFQAGWQRPVGADADHLKTPADIDACVAAGFSFYTLDPSAFVVNEADTATPAKLRAKAEALDWATLESSLADTFARFAGKRLSEFGLRVAPSQTAVLRAMVKYGNAIAHVVKLYRHLAAQLTDFDLEVSVDETESPTTHFEHVYFASEMKRLGVQWVSLAPRFVGRFEKGVDFIGDLAELQSNLNGHATVAKAIGGYKLSLHSGSDKFSVYPLLIEAMGEAVHIKTAGTSYLEALRVAAICQPTLFREIAAFARERYETDKATYHVSADLARVPAIGQLAEGELAGLIDPHDSRQMLHVTFGSVLNEFGERLKTMLRAHAADYENALAKHFDRHLEAF